MLRQWCGKLVSGAPALQASSRSSQQGVLRAQVSLPSGLLWGGLDKGVGGEKPQEGKGGGEAKLQTFTAGANGSPGKKPLCPFRPQPHQREELADPIFLKPPLCPSSLWGPGVGSGSRGGGGLLLGGGGAGD